MLHDRFVRRTAAVILSAVALVALWGFISNVALEFVPPPPFESPASATPNPQPDLQPPWWAISLRQPFVYLDPVLAGPLGTIVYAVVC
jgi:hypothetical protein